MYIFLQEDKKRKLFAKLCYAKAEDDSVLSMLREHLLTSLKDICLNISENFHALTPKYCILFKMDGDDQGNTSLKDKINAIKRNGGRIFKYNDFFNDELVVQSNEVTYGKDSRILFILHVLFAMDVIRLKTMLGDTLCRKRKTQKKHSIRKKNILMRCPSCDGIFGFRPCYFVILLLLLPHVAVLFITPFPYIVFFVLKDSKDVFTLMIVWIILFWLTSASVLMYVFWNSATPYIDLTIVGVIIVVALQIICFLCGLKKE